MEYKRYRFCSLDALKKAKSISRWVDEMRDEVAAMYRDKKFYVISSICPHFGGKFDFIKAKGCSLKCKWHGWEFDLESGKCLTYAVQTKIRHYKFDISNDGYIEVLYL